MKPDTKFRISCFRGIKRLMRGLRYPLAFLGHGRLVRLIVLGLPFTAGIAMGSEAPRVDWDAYKGKVVYVDFWASWCGPCRDSFPWMKDVYARFHEQGLEVVAINLDQERALADAFLAEFHPAFKVLFDAEGKLAQEFKVETMPSSFLIGRDGKPRFRHAGFFEDKTSTYQQEIQSLLQEKP